MENLKYDKHALRPTLAAADVHAITVTEEPIAR
jgi:hypothetical protein